MGEWSDASWDGASSYRHPGRVAPMRLGTAACDAVENFTFSTQVIGLVAYGTVAEAINRQLAIDPDYCDLRHSGATVNLRESCNRAIERGNPDAAVMATYYQARAATWSDRDHAEADYAQAIRIDPGGPDRYTARAYSRWWARAFDQAADDFSAAIGRTPRSDAHALARLHRMSAQANWRAGRADRAAGDYDQVIDLMRPPAS